MSVASVLIKYARVVSCVILLMCIVGIASIPSLPKYEDPKITIREAVLNLQTSTASAEETRELVTLPLERVIKNIDGIESTKSISYASRAVIHIEVEDQIFTLKKIWTQVRSEIAKHQNELPPNTSWQLLDNFGDVAIANIALTSSSRMPFQLEQVAKDYQRALYQLDDVSSVELIGLTNKRIRIDLLRKNLKAYGLTMEKINQQLTERIDLPDITYIETTATGFNVVLKREADDVRALLDTFIVNDSGAFIPFGDIANITLEEQPTKLRDVLHNGERGILLSVKARHSSDIIQLGEAIRQQVSQQAYLKPADVRLSWVTEQAEHVAEAVHSVTLNTAQTLVVVALMVMFFLGLRLGLIIAATIPVVLLMSVSMFSLLGVDIQRMSIASLILSMGLLVDNAIVIAEQYSALREAGNERLQSLQRTLSELASPLFFSTATTVLVFLPLMLAEHVSGEYTRSISIVMALTLFSSWIISITFLPLLLYRFHKPQYKQQQGRLRIWIEHTFRKARIMYVKCLKVTLVWPKTTLSIAILGLLVSIGLATSLPVKFFPDSNRSQLLIYGEFPPSISSVNMREEIARLDGILQETLGADAQSITSYIGFGGPRFVLSLTPVDPQDNRSFTLVNFTNKATMEAARDDLKARLPIAFPNATMRVATMFLGPSDSSLLEIRLTAQENQTLRSSSNELSDWLKTVPGMYGVINPLADTLISVQLTIDEQYRQQLGVTTEAIIAKLRSLSDQTNGFSAFYEGKRVAITLKSNRSGHLQEDIRNLYVNTLDGTAVPLASLVSISLKTRPYKLQTDNTRNAVTVSARNDLLSAEDIVSRYADKFEQIKANLPRGATIEFSGVIEQSKEGQAALQKYLPLCIAIGFVLVILHLNSIRLTSIAFFVLPFMMIGVVAGLYLSNASFGFMIILGIYALAGILINNGIVLIDTFSQRLRDGDSATRAMLQACRSRFKPILMTMLTTIIGFSPLIIYHDPLFYGMACAMTGGLFIGTMISLIMIPTIYSLIFRVSLANR